MNIPFLAEVNQAILKQTTIVIKKYGKGTTLHAQGDSCNAMDIVLTGSLVAYALSQNGSESIVFEFHENSSIGTNLLFGNTNKYPMNIYCTSDCELLHIHRHDVELLLHDYQFTMNFVKSLSFNSQSMNKKIAMYSQKSLRENLLDYFSALSAEQKSSTIILPISKKQLADYLGVQRPSLFRELKFMKEEGLIAIDHRQIHLLC